VIVICSAQSAGMSGRATQCLVSARISPAFPATSGDLLLDTGRKACRRFPVYGQEVRVLTWSAAAAIARLSGTPVTGAAIVVVGGLVALGFSISRGNRYKRESERLSSQFWRRRSQLTALTS
jgi:hypothetical protein